MMADAIVGILAFCCVVCCVKNYDGRVRVCGMFEKNSCGGATSMFVRCSESDRTFVDPT